MAAALHDRDEKEEYLEYVRNQLGKFDQVNWKGLIVYIPMKPKPALK